MDKLIVSKPWGKFEQFTHNEISTVKILSVEPNSALSLQYHHKRDELWRVVAGEGVVQVGEIKHEAKVGDEFFLPKKELHRLSTKDSAIAVLEISFGEFAEDDIVRIEDNYDRS